MRGDEGKVRSGGLPSCERKGPPARGARAGRRTYDGGVDAHLDKLLEVLAAALALRVERAWTRRGQDGRSVTTGQEGAPPGGGEEGGAGVRTDVALFVTK